MDPKLTPEKLHKNRRLCSKHFEDSQFFNPKLKNRLVHDAIPTIFDVPNPPNPVTPKRTDPAKRRKTEPPVKKGKFGPWLIPYFAK